MIDKLLEEYKDILTSSMVCDLKRMNDGDTIVLKIIRNVFIHLVDYELTKKKSNKRCRINKLNKPSPIGNSHYIEVPYFWIRPDQTTGRFRKQIRISDHTCSRERGVNLRHIRSIDNLYREILYHRTIINKYDELKCVDMKIYTKLIADIDEDLFDNVPVTSREVTADLG